MTEPTELPDPVALRTKLAALEAENAALRAESASVATANVHAAMQLVELGEARERALEAENRAIAASLAAAEEASLQKTRFLANMSHELRTPLSGILGMTELLLAGELGAEEREYVRSIATTADSFLELVNQLLDISKIEAGRVELEHVDFDLWDVIESVAQILQVRCDAKGLALGFELAADVPRRVSGDPLRVRQVLLNLVGNAAKFTERGHVHFHATAGAAGAVRVVVHDTGCGIPEDVGDRIFEPFVQGDASTARRFGGTGLGLSICKNLVALMRGEIRFESVPGRGTRFELTLPLHATSACAPATLGRGRALVRVACASARRSVVSHLAALGYECTERIDEVSGPEDLVILERGYAGEVALGFDLERFLADRPAAAATRPRLVVITGRHTETGALGDAGTLCSHADLVLPFPLRPSRLRDGLQAIAAEPVPAAAPLVFPGTRVLLAEDTPVIRRVVVAQLERLGCRVTAVPDGEAVVHAARSETFDVIFMDCQMPGLDGYDATAAIRAHETRTGTRAPIVALTANALAGDRERCLAAGMDDYLAKPVRKDELAEALLRWTRPRAT